MQARRQLVVFYSRSGFTRLLARALAEGLGADLEELKDTRKRSGLIGYLRCGWESTFQRLTPLQPISVEPKDYDLVLVGTPVWNAGVSSPVRSFLVHHGVRCKNVAFFCTYGRSGSERAFRQMAAACGKAPVATLAVRDKEINGPVQRDRIAQLTRQLEAAAARSLTGAASRAERQND